MQTVSGVVVVRVVDPEDRIVRTCRVFSYLCIGHYVMKVFKLSRGPRILSISSVQLDREEGL